MHVIVGLGNVGPKYAHTRHNAGRDMLTAWVLAHAGSLVASAKYRADVWQGEIDEKKVIAAVPQTFMNESGGAVAKLVTSKKAARKLIVLHDDIDLPLGTLRISFARGSGGHNGVRSIAQSLGTDDFVRIRIGISPTVRGVVKKPKGEAAVLAHVMGVWKKQESVALEEMAMRVGKAIEHIIAYGHESAMNAFN